MTTFFVSTRNLPAALQEGEATAAENPGTAGGGEHEEGEARGGPLSGLLPDLPPAQGHQGHGELKDRVQGRSRSRAKKI